MQRQEDIVLSVYFCGSSHSLNNQQWLASILSKNDAAVELNPSSPWYNNSHLEKKSALYKMSFNGCGIEYGLSGALFGTGIDQQCQKVISEIEKLRHQLTASHSKKRIIVNCYGHSRGGVAALLLAKMLGNYPLDMVEVNLAMLDPVPGNSITSAELDIFNFTLANQVMNLKECHNLKSVICLYPYKPLPDYICHAPLKPTYPMRTLVEEDVVLGCHAEAESLFGGENGGMPYLFAASRLIEFMRKCGTIFFREFLNNNFMSPKLQKHDYDEFLTDKKNLVLLPEEGEVVVRNFHSEFPGGNKSVFIKPKQGEFLNRHHRFLATSEPVSKYRSKNYSPSLPDPSTINTLKNLIMEVFTAMSKQSKLSEKGKILSSLFNNINDKELSENAILNISITALRSLCNIALQRDRNSYSLFTTTRSGEKLRNLLHKTKYKYFADLILGTTERPVRYRDLRSFAGIHEAQHFNADHREANYAEINTKLST